MLIQITGAREHNLKQVDVEFGDGLTVVTGVSGSGKSSLVYDTLYHEAHRHFVELFAQGGRGVKLAPARVESIKGLAPSVAIGQNLLNRNPGSTLATATGLHPFLRILFSNFGSRHCSGCDAQLTLWNEEDLVQRLVTLSARESVEVYALLVRAALGSHRTLLASLYSSFGADNVRVDGRTSKTSRRLRSSAPHDIAVRLARLAEPVKLKQARELMSIGRSLGTDLLEVSGRGEIQRLALSPVCAECGCWFDELLPVHFHMSCRYCAGKGCGRCGETGLHEQAAAVRWQGLRLPELLARSVDDLATQFASADLPHSATRLVSEIQRRLQALQSAGLGYVQLDRTAPTLSRGEGQRARLAVALTSRLEGMVHILDEPTIGLHPADVARLVPDLRLLPGPVIFVEHDRVAAAQADRVVDIGPGAGTRGGEILYCGTPAGLWRSDSPTGRFFSLRERMSPLPRRPIAQQFLTIRNAGLHNLKGIDVPLAVARLNVISGVSGSGKSTLVEEVLVASLRQDKAVGCTALEGPRMDVLLVDQSPIGRNPRSNPATYTKLADIIRDAFAAATDLSASHFSFNRPEGACPVCKGMGAVEIAMRYLPSTWIPCSGCDGSRFSEEVRSHRAPFGDRQLSITEFLGLSVDEVHSLIGADTPLSDAKRSAAMRILTALADIGLGYLTLGQASPSLSGGEAQRVKLARHLGSRSLSNKLLVLDEPTTGLHPNDISGLLKVLDRLVRSGATLVVVEHNLDVMTAADWLVDLGPAAGPDGGELIFAGPPGDIQAVEGSLTGLALMEERKIRPRGTPKRKTAAKQQISVRAASCNNLRSVDVDIPKSALTVVTGVSGSGKSSLVRDVLEAEARRRYLESLSMYERQLTREGPEAEVEELAGLGVTVPITARRKFLDPRSSLGSISEISHHLAGLMARVGRLRCESCDTPMVRKDTHWRCSRCGQRQPIAQPRHFIAAIYGSACTTCQGVGTLREPNPAKLIVAEELPLCAGAMYSPGFFPQGYLGKPFNGGYDMLQALGNKYGFDPHVTPWREMQPKAQQVFLFGEDERMQVTFRSRKGRETTRTARYQGFYELILNWDTGGTYTDTLLCPSCRGGRLRPQYLAVKLARFNMQQLANMPLTKLRQVLQTLKIPAKEQVLTAPILEKALLRADLLCKLGLGYLHLDRSTSTLSAGEAQRIQLANILAAGLAGITVLMDERTRGMHPVEVSALLGALKHLTDGGNTAVVVEHDPDVIMAADYLIDMGPGAGSDGGRVVAQGTPAKIARGSTVTGKSLRGRRYKAEPRRQPLEWITIRGARENNLRAEKVSLPLGVLGGVCGVSGSGKSTLIIDTLARVVAPKKQTTSVARETIEPGRHDAIEGAPDRCILLDQTAAGVGSPAGFLNLRKPLQQLYAASEDARSLGIKADTFSDRCSACKGGGYQRLDMGFLPGVHQVCEACNGSGYQAEIGEIKLRGVSLPDLLEKTVAEVLQLWRDETRIASVLQTFCDVGLGYLVLHQPARTLSGGEIQRLKIARELTKRSGANTLYLLDEPTFGLHMADVGQLLSVLERLLAAGSSVIVVEHNLDMLVACDWLVELGPGGGPDGGRIIASGTPERLAEQKTATGTCLHELMG